MKIDTSTRINTQLNGIQLSKLYTFEVAARLGSFALAAHELCLTPSAVSHQISKLENELKLQLFERQHRKVTLTADGEQLFTSVTLALSQLNSSIEQVKSGHISGGLTIYARPSFAHDWLAPRLHDFCEQYPSIDIKLITGNDTLDLNRHGIDLAIYYSNVTPDASWSLKLNEEHVIPVCSPHYANQYALNDETRDLSHCTLLHDNQAWHIHSQLDEWKYWHEHYAEFDIQNCRSVGFDQSTLAVSAAKHGAGIAMGRWSLVKEDIERGDLVMPFPNRLIKSGYYYYLIGVQRTISAKQKCFADWISRQLQICK
ncbi:MULTISPECIES: DNA-binding transcriptional regulator DsdC [Vibrio]|uniref:DNA-binding transcriptional regulator DsdC n=1 Tax=Vibrio TaxID=662 RepID=UPI0001B93DFB|nr:MULTISPECIES: DNA-binding transcriptional regulator DsdC [Vibrio]EEX31875.1 D-serine dehydratase transcriptional activator [Vibrio coralliilyticus ATCC BAA-450]MDE3896944.1 DNA-binding transcriptional regulator DsdC [Vibrio sp. CC007]QFT38188.1 Glycine cleavage system transcriptional activator [Vibrio sp. THAF64]QGM37274.1 Glycine cleavage system transcriptional activator [Vibrio sp. THAF191d]QGN72615.1 Glycine cleavage system transcriptional activator [Vibrio sp. THAF191c]